MKLLIPLLRLRSPRVFSGAAFTLVEVLVVLAILVILSLLLFPGLSKSMEQAQGSVCISHMRTLHHALMSYASDHGGYFPSYRPDNPSTNSKNPGIADYLDLPDAQTDPLESLYHETAFTCPAIQSSKFPSGRPYYMNIAINSRAVSKSSLSESLLLKKPLKVVAPSRLMVFTESARNPTAGSQTQPGKSNYYTHVNWAQVSLLPAPHSGRQNVIFYDGHIKQMEPQDIPSGSQNRDAPFWTGDTPKN